MILFINMVISETGYDDHLEIEVRMPDSKKFTQKRAAPWDER